MACLVPAQSRPTQLQAASRHTSNASTWRSSRKRRLVERWACQAGGGSAGAGGANPPPQLAPCAKGVVLTGATKGLGFAMAQEFLRHGDRVVVCGRDAGRLEAAVAALAAGAGSGRVHGTVCDVASAEQVEALVDFAVTHLETVHIWINNAGKGTANRLLADVPSEEIAEAVGTNVLGTLLGSRAAVRVMRRQPPSEQPAYHIFNMGFSGWGAKFSKSAVTHKATKSALTQANTSLVEELAAAGISSIGVHNLSPGMVLTDLLLGSAPSPAARRAFNALAEEPETVAAALVPRIRAMRGTRGSIDFLTPTDAALRMLTRLPEVVGDGRFFDRHGRRVQLAGQRYRENGVRIQL